ncbi:MAG: glycosyltransferase family 39 protein [Ignavibacteriales bacterium]|nr:glycosyltransferase family 39 protein [Ignavibacteriales bacterium]
MNRFSIHIGVFLFLAVGVAALNTTVAYTPDSARYLAWAKSLAFFEGLQDDTAPDIQRYVVRPPMYPLLLSPVARVFPYDLVAAKIVTLLIGVFAGLILYRWLRESMGTTAAGIGAFLWCLHPLVLTYSTQVLSEIPFITCVIGSFLLLRRISASDVRNPRLDYALVVVLTAGLYLREAGLYLTLSALTFYLLRREKRRALMVLGLPLGFYAFWLLRNELLVAGAEVPEGANLNVLLARLYTTEDVNILEELVLRVRNNLVFYGGIAGKTVLLSGYVRGPLAFILPGSGVDEFFSGILGAVIQVVTAFLLFYGMYNLWKGKNALFFPTAVFVTLYSASLLLFPVTDVRYLFPLVPVVLFYLVNGIVSFFQLLELLSGKSVENSLIMLATIVLLTGPNVTWVVQFSWNNMRYHAAKTENFSDTSAVSRLPAIYRRTLDHVGKWVVQNTRPGTVVTSRWKEAALWLGGRKVLEVTPDLPQDLFDTWLRDYDVRYLVSVNEGSLRDLELHIALSSRFSFHSVYRSADVEVYEIRKKSQFAIDADAGTEVQRDFRKALQLLRESAVVQAESLFQSVINRIGNHSGVLLCLGVAKEFAGEYADAERIFQSFSALPQAGSILQQARHHREMMARLRSAELHPAPSVRAALFQEVATRSRRLGFHKRAEELLRRSLEADSAYFPSLIFAALYAWEDGKLVMAHRFLQRALTVVPENAQVNALAMVVRSTDSLRQTQVLTTRASHWLTIANEFLNFGSRNKAIDVLHELLREDKDNIAALRLLSKLYVSKQMIAPAKRVLSRLLDLKPEDPWASVAFKQIDH